MFFALTCFAVASTALTREETSLSESFFSMAVRITRGSLTLTSSFDLSSSGLLSAFFRGLNLM